ncbi:MAG: BolA family transcriptional regulator [Candidatus Accumulibacter sp.]|uniref:BolA family transcriptional regulator n=1 Tax=Candidatus Accumulibacter affinis TaxID=2954384 RepID=A0A935W854_9PROT|nr:BolA family transcriptional regulator [Candidatus Accumulibacter affinis]MBP9805649.1 BolA family transcriptional regulator [Accumulibacter sp.]
MSDTHAVGAAAEVQTIIQQRLAVLEPLRLQVIDDSARHAGHPGAKGGGGHYRLLIVSAAFTGQGRLARHRMLHDALGDLLRTRIHALGIQALTPAEALATTAIAP